MDCLATPQRRKLLFGLLYLSEGAPIGFIWLGLPTRLRVNDVPVNEITWLLALLILPWTLKFLWAPLIDLLRGPRWGFRHWILVSQTVMAVTLVPLLWLNIQTQFAAISVWLLIHAFAAATQDVSIDALCIQQSAPEERGALNGWMQCGVLVGRAAMGGGSLVLERWIGFAGVVGVLISLILFSAVLLCLARERPLSDATDQPAAVGVATTFVARIQAMFRELFLAVRSGGIRAGFLVAFVVPAGFKSLEAVIGPFLIDQGYSRFQVGEFTATMMIGGMILGSLFAGRLAGRFTSIGFLRVAVAVNLSTIAAVAVTDILADGQQGRPLLVMLTLVAFSIGWLTVALYNWLMNLTSHRLAATQFTAFMATTNACEAWSTSLFGSLQIRFGYPASILVLCAISAIAAAIILRPPGRTATTAV